MTGASIRNLQARPALSGLLPTKMPPVNTKKCKAGQRSCRAAFLSLQLQFHGFYRPFGNDRLGEKHSHDYKQERKKERKMGRKNERTKEKKEREKDRTSKHDKKKNEQISIRQNIPKPN